jgi:hypothetical protein
MHVPQPLSPAGGGNVNRNVQPVSGIEDSPDGEFGLVEQSLLFPGGCTDCCNGSQQATANGAEPIALSAVESAVIANGANHLYTRWFGTQTLSRLTAVTARLQKMSDDASTYTGECLGTYCSSSGAEAWTLIGGDPDLIHLCTPFFSDNSAYDMGGVGKPQALVHEKAHLSAAAVVDKSSSSFCADNSEDDCYFLSDSLRLAANDAAAAIDNASNYALFSGQALASRVIVPSTQWFLLQ